MKLTVATWNMDNWKQTADRRTEAWRFLAQDVRPDVALLQETVPPDDVGSAKILYRQIEGGRRFGPAVVSFEHSITTLDTAVSRYSRARSCDLMKTWPGSVVVARVDVSPAPPLIVISMYGLIDIYAQTTVLRQFADLIPLFDSRFGRRVVLGGDLNLNSQGGPKAIEAMRGKRSSRPLRHSAWPTSSSRRWPTVLRSRAVLASRTDASTSRRTDTAVIAEPSTRTCWVIATTCSLLQSWRIRPSSESSMTNEHGH